MAERYTRGKNPNSLANLQKGHPLKANDERTRAIREKALQKRKTRAEVEKILDENLTEAVDAITSASSFEEYRKRATEGHNQLQRVLARECIDSRRAFGAVQWIFDRIKGKPTQVIDNNLSGDLNVSKPAIVFNDVEGASRKGEEERLQSEEEDI